MTTLSSNDRNHILEKFGANIYERVADATIIETDCENLIIVYSFPMTLPAVQSWGNETMSLTEMTSGVVDSYKIGLDGNPANVQAELLRAELGSNRCIHLKLKFKNAELYDASMARETERILIRYRNTQWTFLEGIRDIKIGRIDLAGVGLLSPAFAVRVPRKKVRSISDEPQVLIRKIGHAGATHGNASLDASKREILVEFADTEQHEIDGVAEPIYISGDCRLQPLIGKSVYPSRDGRQIAGAVRVGQVTAVTWTGDKVMQPDGTEKLTGYAQARIILDESPAGDRELSAWVAKENRAVAFNFQVIRSFRELVKQSYVLRCARCDAVSLTLDGAVALTAAEQHAILNPPPPSEPPAPVKPPGFIARVVNALTPGGAQ